MRNFLYLNLENSNMSLKYVCSFTFRSLLCDSETSTRRAWGPEAARMEAVETVRGSEKWQPCFLALKYTTVIRCGPLRGETITSNPRITEFMMETQG